MQQENIATNKNDEIDLVELIRNLWRKKIWIIGSALLSTAIAAGYAFTAKEQWTSNANITAPRVSELGTMLPIRAEFARITGDNDFSASKLVSGLHGNLRHFLLSDDLKMSFANQSEWIKQQTKDMSDKDKLSFISDFITEDLQIHKPDNEKKDKTELEEIGLKLSFSAESPVDAQTVLADFINYASQYAVNESTKDFNIGFSLLLDNLKFNKQRIENNLKEAKVVKIENLTEALDIAQKAGIKDFVNNSSANKSPEYLLGDAKVNLSDSKLADGTYTFMLGEKYLQAQLDITKASDIIYPLDYHRIVREISQLEPLASKLNDINNVQAYSYLASPDYPVKRDWPKRFIILLVGAFLGGLIGCAVIFVRSLFASKNN